MCGRYGRQDVISKLIYEANARSRVYVMSSRIKISTTFSLHAEVKDADFVYLMLDIMEFGCIGQLEVNVDSGCAHTFIHI